MCFDANTLRAARAAPTGNLSNVGSPSEVYSVLIEKMPDETKDYLRKVTSRKEKYITWR